MLLASTSASGKTRRKSSPRTILDTVPVIPSVSAPVSSIRRIAAFPAHSHGRSQQKEPKRRRQCALFMKAKSKKKKLSGKTAKCAERVEPKQMKERILADCVTPECARAWSNVAVPDCDDETFAPRYGETGRAPSRSRARGSALMRRSWTRIQMVSDFER